MPCFSLITVAIVTTSLQLYNNKNSFNYGVCDQAFLIMGGWLKS